MPDSYNRIFLLSHMRALTSLTGHILGSHPEINGYYEMHLSYTGEDSLQNQLQLYRQTEPLKPGSQFLFDKLLHNNYQLDLTRLKLNPVRILVSTRPPEPSIKSIVHLFNQKQTKALYSSVEQAADYYSNRLNYLAEFCRKNSPQYFYFDAELLRSDPQKLLAVITRWLDLKPPLSEQYQLFSKTGKTRAGDSSDSIKSGKIVAPANSYHTIELPAGILQQAETAYQSCRQIIIENALDYFLGACRT